MLVRRLRLEEDALERGLPPEPDTILRLPDSLIGIEVTQLSPGGQGGRHTEGARRQVVTAARLRCEQEGVPPVLVHIDWEDGFHSSREQQAQIVDDLVQTVTLHAPLPSASVILDRVPDPDLVLPTGISVVKITGLGDGQSGWFSLEYGFPPDVSQADITEAVQRKAGKPSNYKAEYTELWLLLVLGAGGRATWGLIRPELGNLAVTTPYHRVFVFSPFELAVVELTVLSPGA